jgi:hypothetical protein
VRHDRRLRNDRRACGNHGEEIAAKLRGLGRTVVRGLHSGWRPGKIAAQRTHTAAAQAMHRCAAGSGMRRASRARPSAALMATIGASGAEQ